MLVNRVQKYTITPNHKSFSECEILCTKSRNLYNYALFIIRQHFFETKKYLPYLQLYYKVRDSFDYRELPDKVSKQTLKLVDKNFKSFFSLLKLKLKGKYNEKVNIPKYLDKNRKYITTYEKDAISKDKKFLSKGLIKLSMTSILLESKIVNKTNIKQVRIVPKYGYYVIEVVYSKKIDTSLFVKPSSKERVCSADVGVNNLLTLTFSDNKQPLIINGKPLKNINQYYNKKLAEFRSKLDKGIYTSKRIEKLNLKRENKINDYLHKVSKLLVNHLVSNNYHTLVVGRNKEWKQDINNGKKNNQNFVMIPYYKLFSMLEYKLLEKGINLVRQEESYTSKCSFLDNESLCKKDSYLGSRITTKLFKSSKGMVINADVNGSYNIMKKYSNAISDCLHEEIEVLSVIPRQLRT